jgi:hypothetical protein
MAAAAAQLLMFATDSAAGRVGVCGRRLLHAVVTIKYLVLESGNLYIYNMLGQRVASLD